MILMTNPLEKAPVNRDESQYDRFEASLREAVDVPVPADLQARILARRASVHKRRWWHSPWSYLDERWITAAGLAFGLVLVAVLVFYATGLHEPGGRLKEQILAYLEQDWPQLSQRRAVPDEELEGMFHEIGARLAAPVGHVTYCEMTKIGSNPCATLIVRGRAGPVATLFIKDAYVPARIAIHTPRFRGVILPAPQGCIAVLGQPGEDLQLVESRIYKAISWL